MLIDWFTVVAQVVNFLLLVWLLKRFLYRPILKAIDAREAHIAQTLADAAQVQQQAQQERAEFQQHNAEFAQQRTAKLHELHSELQLERQRLLNEANEAAVTLLTKHQTDLASELQHISLEIRTHTQQEVLAITRKALQDLSDSELEQRMVEIFLQRLRDMDATTLSQFNSAFQHAPAQLRSSFQLTAAQQTRIQQQLAQLLNDDIKLQFAVDKELICGITLIGNGQKLAWNLADYLDNLEQRLIALA